MDFKLGSKSVNPWPLFQTSRAVCSGRRADDFKWPPFALAINSGIFIFIRAMPGGLRAVRHCISQKSHKENRHHLPVLIFA